MTLAEELRSILSRRLAAGEISGGVSLLIRDGKTEILDAQGSADHDPAFAIRPDSIFPVMSMTKPVAAACAALLVAQGKMRLDDCVSRYIPEFAASRMVRSLAPGQSPPAFYAGFGPPPPALLDYVEAPANREITVHDLMSFTSGLQTMGIYNRAIPEIDSADTLGSWVAKLGSVPLEFQPGTQWHYSNATGYDVLGRIIEVVSGLSFAEFAQEHLFAPLGMADTGFGISADKLARIVPPGPFAGLPVMRPDYHSGSAGLLSTASDYARFAQMLLDDGRFYGRQVLPPDSIMMMRSNQIGNLAFPGIRAAEYANPDGGARKGIRYGYGVAIVTEPTDGTALPPGSFGWDGIGTRRFWVIPSYRAVLIMLMTGIGPVADATHIEIERAVCATLAVKG